MMPDKELSLNFPVTSPHRHNTTRTQEAGNSLRNLRNGPHLCPTTDDSCHRARLDPSLLKAPTKSLSDSAWQAGQPRQSPIALGAMQSLPSWDRCVASCSLAPAAISYARERDWIMIPRGGSQVFPEGLAPLSDKIDELVGRSERHLRAEIQEQRMKQRSAAGFGSAPSSPLHPVAPPSRAGLTTPAGLRMQRIQVSV